MPFVGECYRRIVGFLRRNRLERDLDDELAFHLALREAEQRAAGRPPDEARATVRRRFGNVGLVKHHTRDAWIWPWLQDLTQDLRFAWRLLVKDRRFTLAAVIALALGIGANTTAFTFVNAVILRDLPFDRPDQLVTLRSVDARGRPLGISIPDFQDWRDSARTFTGMIASIETAMNVSDEGLAAERYAGSYISINVFRLLGRTPVMGRGFLPEDERADAPPVVVIASSVWRSRYGSDPSIIGRPIRVNDVLSTVIGVMPDRFNFPFVNEVWQPMTLAPTAIYDPAKREIRTLTTVAFGRLADSATVPQAQTELGAIAGRLAQAYPTSNKDVSVTVTPVREMYVGGLGQMLLLLMAAAALVLLIACVNVATLLVARASGRSREIAIRASLGATRWRIVRQLVIESLVLGALAGVLGYVFSVYGSRLFALAISSGLVGPPPLWLEGLGGWIVDAPVFTFLAGVSVTTSILFGLAPALYVSRTNINDALKEGGRGGVGSVGTRRWTSALMVVELAVTLVLLATAGLMTRSFLALYRAGRVIDPSGLVTMRLALPTQKYATPDQRKRFYDQLDERLSTNSAFASATVASDVPMMTLTGGVRLLDIDGRPLGAGEKPPVVSYLYIGPRYFETLGLRVLRGRQFTRQDGAAGQEAAIVNQRFAAMFFPDADPLGHRIRLTNAAAPTMPVPWVTIVGVSPTVPQFVAGPEPEPVVYVTVRGEPTPHRFASVIVRGSSGAAAATAAMREEVRKVDRDLPGYFIMTMDQMLAAARMPQQVFGAIFALLAAMALLLAAVGLFAVTAAGVTQRTQEIGVRMALGAQSAQVMWLFMRRTIIQVGLGLAIGSGGVVVLGPMLPEFIVSNVLRRMPLADPLTLGVASSLLMIVAVAATALPSRRAARVDPVVSLRHD